MEETETLDSELSEATAAGGFQALEAIVEVTGMTPTEVQQEIEMHSIDPESEHAFSVRIAEAFIQILRKASSDGLMSWQEASEVLSQNPNALALQKQNPTYTENAVFILLEAFARAIREPKDAIEVMTLALSMGKLYKPFLAPKKP